MSVRKYITRNGVGTPNGIIDAAAEVLTCSVEDLDNIVVQVAQENDAGTATLHIEKTLDGTHWLQVGANLTEASFPAGNGTVVEVSLSDANGMPLPAKAIRLRASALASGGTYDVIVGGKQREGYA